MKNSPERRRQIDRILQDALDCEAEVRPAFLNQACGGDSGLRREVESLLAAHEQAQGFLETPAVQVAAKMLADDPSNAVTVASEEPQSDDQSAQLAAGRLLDGRYLIEKKFGQGGISAVYLARDRRVQDKPVVIKVLLESTHESRHSAWFEKKFLDEITALRRINHPNVVGVSDVGELADGRTYLVMDYIPGENLRFAMTPGGMDFKRAASLLRQMGQALTAAHRQGVIHRDLKPENIMLQSSGDEEHVKLIDFGIATVLETTTHAPGQNTQIAGTPDYMAPEQLVGKPSFASDIYALAVIAYELLTGRRPFASGPPAQLYESQRTGVKTNPRDLRADLTVAAQAVILKALSFLERDRYAQAKDFTEALAQALTAESKNAPPPRLELAHVLFTDLVGYSKSSLEEQARLLRRLQEIVSGTSEFQRAQTHHQLISLPTGDGMALVFFGDPLAPVQCAVEIARAMKQQPELKLRMGIHTGPVQRIADINHQHNISGGGINFAQRVMDCGDAGHILLSDKVADILSQLNEWSPHLQDWGTQEVKHGVKIHIFNLHTGEVGNPVLPEKLRGKSKPHFRIGCVIQLSLAALLILGWGGKLAWERYLQPGKDGPTVGQIPVPVPERQLSYSLEVWKNPARYRNSRPSLSFADMLFEGGDRVRIYVSSPQTGLLYVINEGPMRDNRPPEFNVLYPIVTLNGGAAEVNANQVVQIPPMSTNPENDWLTLDDKVKGVEKFYLVWAEQKVPVLEEVKTQNNPQDMGEIRDPRQIAAVKSYLETNSSNEINIAPDQQTKQTRLTAKGSVLVGLVKLEHR